MTTADFILAAAHTTGLDAEALLHPWLYEKALPPLPAASTASSDGRFCEAMRSAC